MWDTVLSLPFYSVKAFISYTHFVLLSFIIIPPDEALRSAEYHTVHSKLQPQQGR